MSAPLPIPEFKPAQPIPFTDAIAYFRRQAPWISGSSWNTMASLAALKGDQISGVVLLSVLDDVWSQMDRAVAEGKPYSSFVRDVAKVLDARWYQADSKRLKLIYHNNVGGALMAGREAQMSDPDIIAAHPFVMFDGIGDWRQTVEICKPRDGTILPADDPWWRENSPLLHHGCRSGKITLDEEDAQELGGVTDRRKLETFAPAQQGWGRPSNWSAWAPTPQNYHAPLMEEYVRWTKSQSYLHEKQDWDDKWQRFAAEQKFAADAQAAAAAAQAAAAAKELKLKADEALINDPLKAIVWEKRARFDGLKMNGVPIHEAPDGYWSGVSDVQVGEPPLPQGLGKISTGIIVVEDDGRIWVVEPKDHFGGYQHTFPKGKLEPDLTAQQNALKELYEEAGLSAEITGFVGDFKGTTGVSRYYLAKRTGGQPWTAHWESQAVKCVPADELGDYLNTDRDKEILAVLMAKKTGSPIPPGLKSYVAPPPPPEVIAQYPFGLDPARFVYSAAKPGGSTPGMIVVHPDAPGEKYLLKQLSDPFKANAEITGCALYKLANEDVIGVEMLAPELLSKELRGGSRFVTLQRMEPGVESLTGVIGGKGQPDFSKLTTEQQAQLLAHGIASWIAGEHDGHAEQYLLKGGKLLRIDLGQALKYTLSANGDKLDLDYHPNAMYGEARPAHMQLLRAIKEGKIDAAVLSHPTVKAAAEMASKLSESAIEKAVGAYGDLRPGGKSKAEITAMLKKRSENVKKDWAKLFEDVTGKTYAWDAVVKAKPKLKPRVPKQTQENDSAPKLQAGVDLAKAKPSLETFGAVTLLGDGDKLRGQAWRVQRADVVGPRETEANYTITGELDQSIWPELERVMRAKGARDDNWESYARVGLFDRSNDTAKSPVKQFDFLKATNFLGKAIVYDDPGLNYRVTFADSSAKTAMRGKIKIETFSSDPDQAQEMLGNALKELGLDRYKLDVKPAAKDTTLARASRALWNIEGGSYQRPLTVEEATQRLESYGVDVKKLIAQQNSLGYEEPVIPGRWKKYRKEGVRFLYHHFETADAVVRGISGADGGKGGLLSTVARTENGIIRMGSSSSEDLNTGGASSAFARIVGELSTSAAKKWYSEYHYTAIVNPQILDRTDWYAYNYDNWGRTADSSFTSRAGADDHIKTVVRSGQRDNEIMFRNAVAREDILLFAVPDEAMRSSMLESLSSSGVTTIRGQALDEMVVVMKTPNDYSRLNSKNPVHAFLMGKRETCPDWTETYGGTR